MSRTQVTVTGMGMVSAAGIGVEDNWARIRAGQPAAAPHPALAGHPVDFACGAMDFEPAETLGERQADNTDRSTQMALVAAEEALARARLRPADTDVTRFAVVLGTWAGGTATMENQQAQLLRHDAAAVAARTMITGPLSSSAGELSIRFGLQGPVMTIATACASGTSAIGIARDLIRAGIVDVALAGGTDASITPLQVAGFFRLGALSRRTHDPLGASRPFAASRDGLVFGEGAGILVLENDAHARARGAPRLADVAGYSATSDAYHMLRPDPAGAGARRAIRAALADADIGKNDVDYVNAHGTSTRRNDEVECKAISAGLGDTVAVSSTKGVTGHTFGAAGALEAAYSILALTESVIPPTANLIDPDPDITVDLVAGTARHQPVQAVLSNSFGFGGLNASLVLTRP
ncbi:beta-ketoacyl-[acyl-carrier-protein] synthase family protein [Amycolatopsis alba]|uniref:3-oxoacyl-ACP synthase n=1 Tax=Amycolatopsis alba DSM 44262 TaxID=1125972 RepID=A0A229RTF6_AMYAL|nr:beta-ketoacyl-[acyl-carrier-protein] synthase family protein [Amycolatopsis alba]OXM49749.1 3-oxoacyl-ACP synthase [Amycolatopsis alba DSM 44262]